MAQRPSSSEASAGTWTRSGFVASSRASATSPARESFRTGTRANPGGSCSDTAWLAVRLHGPRADKVASFRFGYVEFTNAADAAAALKAMTGAEIDGRPVNIDLSTGRATGSDRADRPSDRAKSYGDSNNPPSDTLYVANVAFGANEDTLSEAFAQYGTINGVRLPTDP